MGLSSVATQASGSATKLGEMVRDSYSRNEGFDQRSDVSTSGGTTESVGTGHAHDFRTGSDRAMDHSSRVSGAETGTRALNESADVAGTGGIGGGGGGLGLSGGRRMSGSGQVSETSQESKDYADRVSQSMGKGDNESVRTGLEAAYAVKHGQATAASFGLSGSKAQDFNRAVEETWRSTEQFSQTQSRVSGIGASQTVDDRWIGSQLASSGAAENFINQARMVDSAGVDRQTAALGGAIGDDTAREAAGAFRAMWHSAQEGNPTAQRAIAEAGLAMTGNSNFSAVSADPSKFSGVADGHLPNVSALERDAGNVAGPGFGQHDLDAARGGVQGAAAHGLAADHEGVGTGAFETAKGHIEDHEGHTGYAMKHDAVVEEGGRLAEAAHHTMSAQTQIDDTYNMASGIGNFLSQGSGMSSPADLQREYGNHYSEAFRQTGGNAVASEMYAMNRMGYGTAASPFSGSAADSRYQALSEQLGHMPGGQSTNQTILEKMGRSKEGATSNEWTYMKSASELARRPEFTGKMEHVRNPGAIGLTDGRPALSEFRDFGNDARSIQMMDPK